jgi:DNA-binding MarR family transcriptional regulator
MRMQDPLVTLSGYLLQRAASSALAELNQQLAPLGLRHAGVAMLMLIEAHPGITQSHAGRILDIQRANMVPFVARLERLGVIRRRRVDGRSQALELTGRGRMLLERARRVVAAHEAELIARVPEKLRPMVLPVLMALWRGTPEAATAYGAGR